MEETNQWSWCSLVCGISTQHPSLCRYGLNKYLDCFSAHCIQSKWTQILGQQIDNLQLSDNLLQFLLKAPSNCNLRAFAIQATLDHMISSGCYSWFLQVEVQVSQISMQSERKCIPYTFPFSTTTFSAKYRVTLSQLAAVTATHQNKSGSTCNTLSNEYYSA